MKLLIGTIFGIAAILWLTAAHTQIFFLYGASLSMVFLGLALSAGVPK